MYKKIFILHVPLKSGSWIPTHGGRSSVGRAPGCGPGGRGFKSRRSPRMTEKFLKILPLFGILVIFGCVQDPPGYPEYNVGVGLFQAGDYEGAVEHFQKATEENPSFAEAYMNLGTSLYRLERYPEAMTAYESADSLFRIGEYVEVRGVEHEEKVNALHEMMDITGAQIKLLDRDDLSDEEIEALKRKIEPQ